MKELSEEILNCDRCRSLLRHAPRPVFSVHREAKILIIGQAPGKKVHQSGIPWDDKSGDQLRRWLGVTPEQFYDPRLFAIVPMGFCYPGKGKSGDLPPLKLCAPTWHHKLLAGMPDIRLTLLVGAYAQRYYLGKAAVGQLTETVKNYKQFLPAYFPLVHPSPRNGIWQKRNPWFEREVVPELRALVGKILR